jgi:hypothetical protein
VACSILALLHLRGTEFLAPCHGCHSLYTASLITTWYSVNFPDPGSHGIYPKDPYRPARSFLIFLLAIGAALFVVAVAVEEINKQLLYIMEHLLNQSCSKYSKNTIFLKSCEESVSSIFCIFLLTLLETAQKIAQD